jgi:hypothetical protein
MNRKTGGVSRFVRTLVVVGTVVGLGLGRIESGS